MAVLTNMSDVKYIDLIKDTVLNIRNWHSLIVIHVTIVSSLIAINLQFIFETILHYLPLRLGPINLKRSANATVVVEIGQISYLDHLAFDQLLLSNLYDLS